jgi:hypothetical protein
MINPYLNGKIYALVSESAGLIYYGSTIQRLSQRKGEHIRDYKNHLNRNGWKCSSFDVLKQEDAKIILIEEFPCSSRLELEQREGHWQLNNNCTNINRAGRNIKEYRKTAEYREQHKLYMRKYRQLNNQTSF